MRRFVRSIPTSLLRFDELDILRLAFPVWRRWPAETTVDVDALRLEWENDHGLRESYQETFEAVYEELLASHEDEAGNSSAERRVRDTSDPPTNPFEAYVFEQRFGPESLWGQVGERCGPTIARSIDPEFERYRVVQRVTDLAAECAEACGVHVPNHWRLPAGAASEFVDQLLSRLRHQAACVEC